VAVGIAADHAAFFARGADKRRAAGLAAREAGAPALFAVIVCAAAFPLRAQLAPLGEQTLDLVWVSGVAGALSILCALFITAGALSLHRVTEALAVEENARTQAQRRFWRPLRNALPVRSAFAAAAIVGGAVIGRYAIARFNLQTRGKPSHAGWALKDGVSAIAEMAKHVAVIEGMTSDDCTFSLGVFNAGQWVNCVSSVCDAEVLSMAKTQEQLDAGIAKMMALNADQGNVVMEVTRGVTRPVWEPDQPGTMAMLGVAQEISRELGFEMTGQSAGGGSDGNFTGYLGLPTLDSIGVRGQGLHTLTEHIEVDSLVERAKLAAGLYCRLGA